MPPQSTAPSLHCPIAPLPHSSGGYDVPVKLFSVLLLSLLPVTALAQTAPPREADTRAQFPHWLQDSFIDVHVGGLHYPFSARQLEPGFTVGKVERPLPAVRLALIGKQFTERLSAQVTYMRPVQYVSYRGINGRSQDRTVWMHYATATLKARAPIGRRLSFYVEAGGALATRGGFSLDGRDVVRDVTYGTAVAGAGLDYRVNDRWTLTGGATYIPGKASEEQPRSLFVAGGFRYTLRRQSDARVAEVVQAGRIFPRTLVHVELTGGKGYSVNNFFSRKVPIFWGGNPRVDRGLAVHVERNVFHSRSLFSIGFGASVGAWQTQRLDERFYTVSVYPLLRFTFVRTRPLDIYFMHSMAGPTFISRTVLDGHDTGKRFTFQDFMGIGMFAGARRQFHLGVKINHYSNGNIFPQNAGVKIPLTLIAGITF